MIIESPKIRLAKKSDKKFLNVLKVWGVCIGDLGMILFQKKHFFGSFPTYIGHTYLTYAFYACHTRGRKGRPVKQRGDALTLGTSNCQRCSPAVSQQIVLTIIMFADNDVFIIITANVTPA